MYGPFVIHTTRTLSPGNPQTPHRIFKVTDRCRERFETGFEYQLKTMQFIDNFVLEKSQDSVTEVVVGEGNISIGSDRMNNAMATLEICVSTELVENN